MLHYSKHAVAITICCFWAIGCSRLNVDVSETSSGSEVPESADHSIELPVAQEVPRTDGPTEDDYPELHNLIQVTQKIYSGGEPNCDAAFAALARLGVNTVVSVDGARPDIEGARKHGLRYVHIPIGYDGVNSDAGQSIARLVRDAHGPFYIHCHHGKHRGPAAAAVACIALGETDGEQAVKILERAGTSKRYAGLWRDVENYQVPNKDIDLPLLVSFAEVSSFAVAMAQIDRAYDGLKLCRDAGWSRPSEHPDLVPDQEALLLKEGLRESARNLTDAFGDEFREWLADAESIAQELEDLLIANKPADQVSQQFQLLEEACGRCHDKYRD